MGQPYKCRETELIPIPRYCIRILHKLGSCHLGEVNICELEGREEHVAVRTMRGDCVRELKFLCALNDANIVRTLGVCTAENPPWAVIEYPAQHGDLAQLLNNNNSIT